MPLQHLALAHAFALLLVPAQDDGPRTVPEVTDHARTSTSAEVRAFLDALEELPHAARLKRAVIGTTREDRPLEVVTVADPMPVDEAALRADGRVRVFVNANIHGGEVEGKEAVQELLRDFALGRHAALLEDVVVIFLPVYNADGNDRIARTNRVSQNGPDGGVGERANAEGLDLNRDFMKVRAPETGALVTLLDRLDPHLFIDLHTTNGTDHGYHLTYAPSLVPGLDPGLERYARDVLLPSVRRATLERHGVRTFDYGNLSRRRDPDAPAEWATYDHRPRFGTNMVGLRNRLSLLSEAYSYLAYPERIAATRAFVLEALRHAARDAEQIRDVCAAADRRTTESLWTLPVDAELVPGEPFALLMQRVDTALVDLGDGESGRRRVASGELHEVDALARVAFRGGREVDLGLEPDGAWLVPGGRAPFVLALHGVRIGQLSEPVELDVRVFRVSAAQRARRPFQGHHERTCEGAWEFARMTVPEGTLVVPRAQPLARLAAWLLEPESDDSLTTWNFFDDELDAALAEGGDGLFPILRLPRGGAALPLR